MKDNRQKIAAMVFKDVAMLVVFLAAFLGISGFVFFQVLDIVGDGGVRLLLTAAFALAMVVLSGSIVWVIAYLRRSRDEVYGEDLHYQDLIRQQKEAKRG